MESNLIGKHKKISYYVLLYFSPLKTSQGENKGSGLKTKGLSNDLTDALSVCP
jgi:hypothetical protein